MLIYDPNTSRRWRGGPPERVNLRDFLRGGEQPTASHDLSAAFQAAIEECCGGGDPTTTVRRALYGLDLPSGTIMLGSPVAIQSVMGFNLRGQGDSTIIKPANTGNISCLLDINGVAYSTFRDFLMESPGQPSKTVTRALWVRWNGMARSTTGLDFYNIRIRDLRYIKGIEVGDSTNPGVQVDNTNWYGCQVSGGGKNDATWWQSGFHFGEGTFANNLLHCAYGCRVNHNKSGVLVSATDLGWWGGVNNANGVDFNVPSVGHFAVQGFRSEGSERLFDSGEASYSQHASIEDVVFVADQLHVDQAFIRCRSGGSYYFRNIHIPVRAGQTPTISGSGPGPSPHIITIEGCASRSTAAQFATTARTNGVVKIHSYIQLDSVTGGAGTLTVG